jgi:hypothetical protein
VQSVDALMHALGEWLTPDGETTTHESVFFDDAMLSLGGDARARARRRVEHGSLLPGGDARYTVDVPKRMRSALVRDEAMSLGAAADAARRAFERDGLGPYCAAQWKRQHYKLADVGTLVLDTDVTYYGVVDGAFVEAGVEHHPRVALRLNEKPGRRLSAALTMLPRLPHSTKRWMGYFRMRKLVKPKRVNELPGYEYEVKLDLRGAAPEIDASCLPMPVHRVYQTESTRYYYEGHRVQFRAFRTERATLVRKGEVEMVDGVPRRSEEKQRGLSPWELQRPRYALRRIKKTYLLLHPETERMYNLCLEVCRTDGDEMTQIEIEYRGRVSMPATPQKRETIERAVLADMRAIRDALIERHGLEETGATKRAWLKKQAGTAV